MCVCLWFACVCLIVLFLLYTCHFLAHFIFISLFLSDISASLEFRIVSANFNAFLPEYSHSQLYVNMYVCACRCVANKLLTIAKLAFCLLTFCYALLQLQRRELTNCLTSGGAYLTHTYTHTHRERDACESVLACGWLVGLMCVSGARVSKRGIGSVCDLAWRTLCSNSPTTTTATAACHWSVTSCDNRALFANCTLHSVRKRGTKGWGERERVWVSKSEREDNGNNCTCKCNSQIRKHIVIICIAKCVSWQRELIKWITAINALTHTHICTRIYVRFTQLRLWNKIPNNKSRRRQHNNDDDESLNKVKVVIIKSFKYLYSFICICKYRKT